MRNGWQPWIMFPWMTGTPPFNSMYSIVLPVTVAD